MLPENADRSVCDGSDSLLAAGWPVGNTQQPEQPFGSPTTAKPPGIRHPASGANTVGFSAGSAEPTRSSRQSVTHARYPAEEEGRCI
jgi:hypothetical protein